MNFIWRFLRFLSVFSVVIIAVVIVGIVYYIEFVLPNIDALNTVQFQVPLQIYTHDGKLMAEYGEKRRIPIPYNKIPKPLINAVLATEDQRYFQHPGVDVPGLLRAAVKLIATGRKQEGGSTITMQVARSFYLTRNKTFGRKLREILLALKIDHKLTKQKILELYLNKIFLGARAYGVEAAAEIYYGKTLDQLSLAEYAMLAGLPKAPSALNPISYPDAALKRRDHVLARMYELGYINEKDYKEALAAPIRTHYHELQTQVKAPYAAELVRQQLEQMYGDSIYTDGFSVYTTLDSHLQNLANQTIHDHLIAYDQRHGYRGPEKNLGVPDLKNMEQWEKILNDLPVINGLEAAAVVDMTDKSVTVLRADGNMTTITWQNLAWARKQLDADTLGGMPRKASDILKLGDRIRIMSTSSGWRLAQLPVAQAGIISLNPQDGQILALVGGFDYQTSKFNRITSAQRQPGSSFKPFIYSAALDKGYTLATVINDAPIVLYNPIDNTLWRPQNDEHKFYGPTRLREGLIHSRNLVSIRLLGLIGTHYAVKYIQRYGFEASQLPPVLSLALGTALVTPLQMAVGYTVFANGGFKVTPYVIDNIKNSQGQIIYQAKPLVACSKCTPEMMEKKNSPYAPRVISPQIAFLITSALRDVIQHGTASQARSLARADLAGKTGTTQNQVDAWFIGYNPDFVTLTWIGFDTQQRSLHEYGAQAALPMWMQFMQGALQGRPQHPFEQPTDIVNIKIDAKTGKRITDNGANAMFEYFMNSVVPETEKNPEPTESTSSPAEESVSEENGGVY